MAFNRDEIERQLRKYSEERKGEAPPFLLSPEGRRRLQREVDREFDSREKKRPWSGFLPVLWPGFAFAALLLFALGTALYFLRPAGELPVALVQKEKGTSPGKEIQKDILEQVPPGKKLPGAEAKQQEATKLTAVPEAPGSAPSAPARSRDERSAVERLESSANKPVPESKAGPETDLARKTEAPQVLPPARPLTEPAEERLLRQRSNTGDLAKAALGEAPSQESSRSYLYFAQTSPNAGDNRALQLHDTAPPPPILSRFQLEQSGPELKILDADGSIYLGAIEVAGATSTVRMPVSAAAPVERRMSLGRETAVAGKASLASNYGFIATGLNLTLNQNVELRGQVAVSQETPALSQRAKSAAPSVQGIGSKRDARASGAPFRASARIGAAAPLAIEATNISQSDFVQAGVPAQTVARLDPEKLARSKSLGFADDLASGRKPAAWSGHFRQEGAGSELTAAVLRSFALELDGAAVRVVDADGSIYSGSGAFSGAAGLAAKKPGTLPASVYTFEVKGTNQTLKAPVTLRGELRGPVSGSVEKLQERGPGLRDGQRPSISIEGNVTVGTRAAAIRARISGE